MARVCQNRNKKTGRFQKRASAATKRVCYTTGGRNKKAGSRAKSTGRRAKQCRYKAGKRKGQFKKC